jgi:hypothetical protein
MASLLLRPMPHDIQPNVKISFNLCVGVLSAEAGRSRVRAFAGTTGIRVAVRVSEDNYNRPPQHIPMTTCGVVGPHKLFRSWTPEEAKVVFRFSPRGKAGGRRETW